MWDTLEKKDIKIDLRTYTMELFEIMNDKSMMIFNGRVFHEAIKGLVNKRLFCGFKDKLFKEILGNLLKILKNSLKNLSGYQVVKK